MAIKGSLTNLINKHPPDKIHNMNEQNPNLIELPMLRNWGDDEWRKRSACSGGNTNLFFPTKEDHSSCSHQIAMSRLICVTCPVRLECLKFALENNEKHGIWGGIVPRDRRKLDINNPDHTIPVSVVIKDLRKVRGSKNSVPFIQQFSSLLKVSTAEAKRMIANASTERV
jgi:WhiB family transcriptional regulator, redox-sensing transcriptional regulator